MPALAVTIVIAVATGAAGLPPRAAFADSVTRTATTRGRQTETTARIDVRLVSPWVAADGELRVDFNAPNAPAGSRLRWRLHSNLTTDGPTSLADKIDAAAAGDTGDVVQPGRSIALDELRSPSGFRLTLPIRSTRDSDPARVFVPNAGVHPVDLELTSADNTILDATTVFLQRLPSEAQRSPGVPLRVAMVTSHGDATVDDEGAAVSSTDRQKTRQWAAAVAASAVPWTINLSPAWVDTLDEETTATVRAALSGRTVIWTTWLPFDLESWARTGEPIDFETSLLAGRTSLEAVTSGPDVRGWPADPHVALSALPALSAVGASVLAIDERQLAGTSAPPIGRRLPIAGAPATISGVLVHRRATAALAAESAAAASSGADTVATPTHDGRRVNLAFAHLVATWFESDGPRGTVVETPGDPSLLTAISDALSVLPAGGTPQPIQLTTLATVLDGVPAERSGIQLREPATVDDVAALSRRLEIERRRLRGIESMRSDDSPPLLIDNHLVAVTDARLDATERSQRLRLAASAIDDVVAAIEGPGDRTVTLTARQAVVPVRVANSSEQTLNAVIHFSSSRLDIDDGEEIAVRIEPGENTIDVPVNVRTSGQFVVLAELRSPDGSVTIDRWSIRVRSTAFSGVGLVLGGGALVFLLFWWARTWRRERIARARRRRTHPVDR